MPVNIIYIIQAAQQPGPTAELQLRAEDTLIRAIRLRTREEAQQLIAHPGEIATARVIALAERLLPSLKPTRSIAGTLSSAINARGRTTG